MSKNIFRKSAMDRLASPEQLDRLVPVTDSKAWLAIFMLMSMLAAAIVWSFVGSLPSRVKGDGILIIEGGRVFDAVAQADGIVERLEVSIDDLVEKDQIVARLSQRDLQIELDNMIATVDEAKSELRRVQADVERQSELQDDALKEQISATNERVEVAQERLKNARERLEEYEDLLERGRVTNDAVLDRQLAVDAILKELGELRQVLSDIEVRRFDALANNNERIEQARQSVAETERRQAAIESQLQRGSVIVTPAAGRVTELQATAGELLGRGEAALSFETLGDSLELVLYVNPSDGKSVEPGMRVQVSPLTAAREEYGTIRGEVTQVSEFPSTVDGMMAVLRNNELVRQFSTSGPPYRAIVRLDRDPDSVSGYAWTSDRGAGLELRSGTLTEAEVTVRTQRPIEMVIPLLREWTGL
ncbi:NHLP bacteriocin system secretion protein [Rhodobacteraceae bacterium B1Z28]|uniref:NHLP bacteriocin system secretion protein n=1 Tax=Ruegeria haliotis TaxID=2747601 RepID=A0ABX2PYG1_9RHOB|nr:NHLP bacteriocin system secretion protein [Ruegeria haliotis]NVO58356.1 NHLP bacteriocin system secretion protein [Ruegeria haliotis]